VTHQLDVVIFGGGIAGLWTLAVLTDAGYRAALLESATLGGVQSIASQGIIHGGTKYALGGVLTDSAKAIGDMPRVWRECLEGRGDVDLRRVRVLSAHQYLWSTRSLTSRLAGFFAGQLMQSRMRSVPAPERPELFSGGWLDGDLYRLDEPVLDVPSLMAALALRVGASCYQADPDKVQLDPARPGRIRLDTPDGACLLEAQRLVLCAGAGNAAILGRLGRDTPPMQRRPLHMVMVRGRLPQVYAHCLGASTTPRLTISSYALDDGECAWYLGGQVAESGVERDEAGQIAAARAELDALLPSVDWGLARYATLRVDRAERATADGRRPEQAFVGSERGVITVWPTKLAFAPRVARWVREALQQEAVLPTPGPVEPLPLPTPPLALPPWEAVPRWS
jgi:glycerol-3-phosphate dehydrogenase